MIERRRLGGSTLEVSALGLGCMSMSGAYGPGDDAQSIAVIHRALDLGVNFLDSSDMYGWGHNETLLGQALRGRRERAVVVTKFGNMRKPDGTPGVDGRPEWVPQACDASLKRLGVDVIDLYYQHRVDPKVPIEDTVGAMSRLVEAGKVRFLGLSEAAPATVRRAQKVHPLAAVQMEYSLLYRVEAEQTLPTLREEPREHELAGRAALVARELLDLAYELDVALEVLFLEARMLPAPVVLGNVGEFVDLAGEQAATQRRVRDQRDPELAQRRQCLLGLHAIEQ